MERNKHGEPIERTSFFLSGELTVGLEQLKKRDGVPESESVRRALRAYLAEKGLDLEVLKVEAAKRVAPKKTKKASRTK